MADAHARMCAGCTVLTLHQGCGLTNAMTGIGEAAKSRTPLIVLAAEVAGSAVRANFRVDQDALARAVGAVPERLHSADSAVADVVRAFRLARQQRRTVVLSMPLDVQAADRPAPIPDTAIEPWGPSRPDTASVAVAGRAPRRGGAAGVHRRPRRPGRRPELEVLAARCGALLTTSAVAHGLFAGAEWSLGICGGFATDLAASLVAEADLVVAWGASLTMWTTRHGALIGSGTTVVQVDDDAAALGANRPVDLGVLGDVGELARDLATTVSGSPGYRTAEVAKRLEAEGRWSLVPIGRQTSSGERIDPRVLLSALDELLPMRADRLGRLRQLHGLSRPYLSVPDGFGFCFTQAFQSMGLGLSTAIGAALARPDRLTVSAPGTGASSWASPNWRRRPFRFELPVVCIIYNDRRLRGGGSPLARAPVPGRPTIDSDGGPTVDLGTVTFPTPTSPRSAGASVRRGDSPERGGSCCGPHLATGGPIPALVIDAEVASDSGTWWLAEAFKGH